jgi:hypothetical protein
VLRSKYYPDGRILEANLKKGFFFTWQSIIAGLQTFEKEPSGEWRMEIRLIYGMTRGLKSYWESFYTKRTIAVNEGG